MTITDYFYALFVAFVISLVIGYVAGMTISSTNKSLF